MSSYSNYNNHGRSSRPSPPGVDSHSGSSYAEQQGRTTTTLPPLTIAFPTSLDPPVPHNYQNPYPTQSRATPATVPYQQPYYSSTQQQTQTAYPTSSYPSYNAHSDQRYHGGQQYGSYNHRASPSSDSRRNLLPPPPPPLSVPPQGSQYYQTHTDLQASHIQGEMRPSHTPYSPQAAPNYPQYQSLNSTTYLAGHGSLRGPVPSDVHPNPHYPHPHNQPTSMPHASQGRPASSSRPTQSYAPYPRPPLADYEPPVETTEPQIKKKRKRADARQLEVLNGTYTRTAFPSTEERAQLAKDLDMSARSVQIWFQNKRQAARQGGRNIVVAPSGAPEPTPTPPAGYHRGSPALMSPMVETPGPSYSSRSPPPAGRRSGQTPSPPSGRTHADIDPTGRHWSGPRGY